MLKLMEALEDSDDVQHVYANFDISAEEWREIKPVTGKQVLIPN